MPIQRMQNRELGMRAWRVYQGRPVKFRQFGGAGKSLFLDTEFEITKGKCQVCFKDKSKVLLRTKLYTNQNVPYK